jgi:hypothetical protein
MPDMLARRMPIRGWEEITAGAGFTAMQARGAVVEVTVCGTCGRLIGHRGGGKSAAVPKDNARRRYSGRSPPLRTFDMLRPYGAREIDGVSPSRHGSQKSRRGRRRYEKQQRTPTAKTRCRAEARRYENLCARAILARQAKPRSAITEDQISGQNMWSIQIWREGKTSSAEMPRRKVLKD